MVGFRNAVRAMTARRSAPDGERRTGRPRRLLTVWAVVIVVLAIGVGVVFVQAQQYRADEQGRGEALKAAKKNLSEVLSYSFRTIDDDVSRAKEHLTGKFADDFSQFADKLIVPNAKSNQITTDVEVVANSSVDVQDDRVVALLFVNQTTNQKGAKEPRIDGSRIRLTMERIDDRWLISELTPV